MTDTERSRIEAICKVARVNDIGKLSDGFHTFNSLYEQRMILFAALVKAYKDKAWKSYRHEDGEYCFGGGWFIVGIDTPEGSYTYHYENKYWDMFDCIDLPRAKHWDGHTEADAETRLMSLPERKTDGDTISRQSAIDALRVAYWDDNIQSAKDDPCIVDAMTDWAIRQVKALPSAQQEHKWETCFDCPLSHGCPKIKGYTNEQAIEYASQIPNGCPLNEPYKVGHWVKVHGYATPGGDPVWACSECGKGIHVYGIEHGTYGADVSDGQWVSCPNCGAVMEEE